MANKIKGLNKYELYKTMKWFSKDCEELVNKLNRFGLAIVPVKEIEEVNRFLCRLEDDGK